MHKHKILLLHINIEIFFYFEICNNLHILHYIIQIHVALYLNLFKFNLIKKLNQLLTKYIIYKIIKVIFFKLYN